MVHRTSPEKTIGVKHIRWEEFSSIPILHWYLHPDFFFLQLQAAPGPFCTPLLNSLSPSLLGLDAEPDGFCALVGRDDSCFCSLRDSRGMTSTLHSMPSCLVLRFRYIRFHSASHMLHHAAALARSRARLAALASPRSPPRLAALAV